MDYQKRNASVVQSQGPVQQKAQVANAGSVGAMDQQKTQPLPEAKNTGKVLKRGQDGKFIFDEASLKALIDSDFKTAYSNESKREFNKTRLLQKLGFNTKEFDKASINAFAEWQESVGLKPTARYDVLTRKTDFVLEMAEAAEKAGTNNPVLAAGQGMLESAYSFRAGYNQGGVKATQADIANGKYTLEWTTERLTQTQLEATKTKVDNDPKRSYHPENPGHKYKILGQDGGKTKISMQDYFKTFDTLEDYLVAHGATVKNIVTKFVSQANYRSKFYEPDASKREAKIAEILADSTKTLECIQSSGINSGNYATAANYAETVGPCVRQAQQIIDRAAMARARANGNAGTGAVTGNATTGAVTANSEHEADAGQNLNGSNDKIEAGGAQTTETPAAPAVEYPNIDVTDAIKYNTRRNPGMLEYLQTYLGIAKTNEYDEITVKSIAKWQKGTKGKLVVDGKFGDKSYEYAMDNGLRQIMPTMLDEVVITGKKGGASTNDGDGAGGGSAGGGDGKEDKPVPETPEVASSGDWKKDLVSAGLAEDEIYEGNEALTYGHAFIKDKSKRPNRGSYKATVGNVITDGSAKNFNAVKTLQALLNRSLKETALPKANADSTKIVEAGKLTIDGKWGANTVAHLVYFIDAAGYNVDNYLAKYTVKCTPEIWKDLRNKKSLDINKVKESIDSSKLADVGGSHKIVFGGEKAYNKMNKDSGNSLGISSSFRSFSSHGMAKAGMGKNTGQLELFALRVAGVKDSDAAVPTHTPSGASHMTGKALDIKTGKSWVTNNGSAYGFTGISSENWHFNFDPDTWAKSPKNPDRNNK